MSHQLVTFQIPGKYNKVRGFILSGVVKRDYSAFTCSKPTIEILDSIETLMTSLLCFISSYSVRM